MKEYFVEFISSYKVCPECTFCNKAYVQANYAGEAITEAKKTVRSNENFIQAIKVAEV